MAKNGKRSDKPDKRDRKAKRKKRSRSAPRAPMRDLPRSAPAAMAVAAGALIAAGITSLWRVRR